MGILNEDLQTVFETLYSSNFDGLPTRFRHQQLSGAKKPHGGSHFTTCLFQ